MKSKIVLLAACMSCAVSGQQIYRLSNAAAPTWGELAPGSLFLIYGTDLGPVAPIRAETGALPALLGGTSVVITAGGFTRQATVLFSSSNAVGGIVPADLSPGTATLRVDYNGKSSRAETVSVVTRSFALFTKNGRGSGAENGWLAPALAQNYHDGEYRLNDFLEPARPGDLVVLWGTGLGPEPENVEVLIGGLRVKPNYAGPSGCCAGFDEVIFQVPARVTGCFMPVMVSVAGGRYSRNTPTISVSAEGPCLDPHNLTAPELGRAYTDQKLSEGRISVGGTFADRQWRQDLPSLGTCAISSSPLPIPSVFLPQAIAAVYAGSYADRRGLDAGPTLTYRFAGGVFEVRQETTGLYRTSMISSNPYAGPELTVDNGRGGKDVGPFSATIAVPRERLNLLDPPDNLVYNTLDSQQDFIVRWDPSGHDGEFLLLIAGNDDGLIGEETFATVLCATAATEGKLTLPSYALQRLKGSLSAYIAIGVRGYPQRFQAAGLDAGFFHYEMGVYWLNSRVR